MAGLVPAIHDLFDCMHRKTWMPGAGPGMMNVRSAPENGARADIPDPPAASKTNTLTRLWLLEKARLTRS